jgi:hypothetical protein
MAKAAGRPKGSRNNKSKNTTSDDNNASDEALVNDAISRAISSNDTDSVISSLVDGDEARMILETASTSNSAGITVVDLVDLSSQTAICSQIVKGRIEEDTRKGYERTLRFIVGICDVLCPLAIDKDTKQLRLPMKLCDLVAFLGEVAKERENKSVRAVSTITGYITAIKHAHTEASIPLSKAVDDYLVKFVNGYGRLVAKKKETGLMKNFEGKVALTFSLFVDLCKKSLFACDLRSTFSRFVHLFGILCWNMFARSNSVANLRTNHIIWENDAMLVDMSRHKADQTGENTTPKHIYANPYQPEICPILAMGLHFFSISYRETGEDHSKIFVGTLPYDAFSRWLRETLTSIDIIIT